VSGAGTQKTSHRSFQVGCIWLIDVLEFGAPALARRDVSSDPPRPAGRGSEVTMNKPPKFRS